MTVKLIWTPGAARDLEHIHAYIAADAPHYADVVAAELWTPLNTLRTFCNPDVSCPNSAAPTCGNSFRIATGS
jgi:plasmid stabilization system protein ParE